jgi:hypothetical protein
MRDVGFVDWLKAEKGYTARAASDVLSRVRRIKRMVAQYDKETQFEDNLIGAIEKTEAFIGLTKSVKSQLRRAHTLYIEHTATQCEGA